MPEFDLRKEEYLSLRKEIEMQLTELGQLERNCILAAAAVYAWLVKDGADSPIAQFGWYIPILFSFFGALRSLSLGLHIFALGKYIYKIESAYLTDGKWPSGWEHFLATPKNKRRVRTVITMVFWMTFLTITVGVALKYGCGPYQPVDDVSAVIMTPRR